MEVTEPVPVDDDLCTQLYRIEDLGFGARLVLVHRQTCYESDTPLLVVKRKLVLPYPELVRANQQTREFLVQHGKARGPIVLVK